MNYEKIIEENSKMIWKIANSFYNVNKSDLYQAGIVGLLKAIKKYNKESTAKFSTYAHDYIFGEMYVLANNKNIKVSKDIINLYKKIEMVRYNLAQKLNRIPNNEEISKFLSVDKRLIDEAINSASIILSVDEEKDNERSIKDIVKSNDEELDLKILLNDSMNKLTDEEKNIIKARYYEDLTQSEVAKKLNMTQVMVSRYEKRSLKKMRDYITL